MRLEIFSLIGGFPLLPGPLDQSSTVSIVALRGPERASAFRNMLCFKTAYYDCKTGFGWLCFKTAFYTTVRFWLCLAG